MFVSGAPQIFVAEDYINICPDSRYFSLFCSLSNENADIRLGALRELTELEKRGIIPFPEKKSGCFCTPSQYSFSPLSPSLAAYIAHRKGIDAEISDLFSTAAVREFSDACDITDVPFRINTVYKAHLKNTPFYGRQANCPEISCIYLAAADISPSDAERLDNVMAARRKASLPRIAAENWALRSLLGNKDIMPDFWNDIREPGDADSPCSITVSEQHLFYMLAKNIISKTNAPAACAKEILGCGAEVLSFMKENKRHKMLMLAELLDRKLRNRITYSSFEDKDLKADTPHINAVISEITDIAAKPVYPLTKYDEVKDMEKFMEFLKKSGISAVAVSEDTPLSITAEQLGMSVIKKDFLPRYRPHIR